VIEVELAEFFKRQQIVQLGDPGVELLQRLVLAGDFLRQEELHHQEYRKQKHDREHQRRQRVDEARPVIESAFAAACTGKGHRRSLKLLSESGSTSAVCPLSHG